MMPETSTSLAEALRGSRGLEKVFLRYWNPVECYIRAGWRIPGQEATDLAQEFFLRLFEDGSLTRYSQERGGLRTYLKVLLRHFLTDRTRAASSIKRGGGIRFVPLDCITVEADTAFDLEWRREVMDRAMAQVRAGSKGILWSVFESYDLVPAAERPTYEDLARQLGIQESDVRRALFSVRERLREAVRQELMRDARNVQDEWDGLFRE